MVTHRGRPGSSKRMKRHSKSHPTAPADCTTGDGSRTGGSTKTWVASSVATLVAVSIWLAAATLLLHHATSGAARAAAARATPNKHQIMTDRGGAAPLGNLGSTPGARQQLATAAGAGEGLRTDLDAEPDLYSFLDSMLYDDESDDLDFGNYPGNMPSDSSSSSSSPHDGVHPDRRLLAIGDTNFKYTWNGLKGRKTTITGTANKASTKVSVEKGKPGAGGGGGGGGGSGGR